MKAFTVPDLEKTGKVCPQCSSVYVPMYRVAVSPCGHILPVPCERQRVEYGIHSWISTLSLCGQVVFGRRRYLVSHRFMREYEFMALLLDRYPELNGKPWTVDIVPEPAMEELVIEYSVVRDDSNQEPETEYFI